MQPASDVPSRAIISHLMQILKQFSLFMRVKRVYRSFARVRYLILLAKIKPVIEMRKRRKPAPLLENL